ncbi:MAG: hypothetical protein HC938_17325, partial [Nitrospira sp.]|nr:hypothetical protein [Nitrospira sp.]
FVRCHFAEEIDPAEWDRVMEVNLRGVFLTAREGAKRSTGEVLCWGSTGFLEIATENNSSDTLVPTPARELDHAVKFWSSDHGDGCARWKSGETKCWGMGPGALADGDRARITRCRWPRTCWTGSSTRPKTANPPSGPKRELPRRAQPLRPGPELRSAADSILAVLQRRDGFSLSDDIIVGVDSYHDKRTGYLFRLTAAGAMSDGYMFNDGEEDWGWNAVWQGSARVDSLGWVAEYRIPLSQLRYVPSGENTMGFFISRRSARKGERMAWPLFRRSKTGNVSQWGEIPGFVGLQAPRRVELMPYSVAKYGYKPLGDGTPRDAAGSQFGADLKVGLTSNVTLDAAINPDFGQVEADPGVLNLSAFEQFFAERRPFFLEGSGIFRYDIDCNDGDCTGLFYSRRIGRTPQLSGQYGDAASPRQSTILGAAKVTGRLGNGLSIGLIDAVTDRVQGTQARTIEPLTNYGVVRLQQDLRGGNSGIGMMLTNTTRRVDEWTQDVLRGVRLDGRP